MYILLCLPCRFRLSSTAAGQCNNDFVTGMGPPYSHLGISDTREADYLIQTSFARRLVSLNGPYVSVNNSIDSSSPSVDFEFINGYAFGAGVDPPDPAAIAGCGQVRAIDRHGRKNNAGLCRPDMGQDIGCEYTQVCECLEFAAVDLRRLTKEQHDAYEQDPSIGSYLPKMFPYFGPGTSKKGCMVSFYLESRNPVYECNPRCACGPRCKSRLVQRGRTVPLEIFKTETRGFGTIYASSRPCSY